MNKLNLSKYFRKYSYLYFIALLAMTAATLLDQAAPLIVQHPYCCVQPMRLASST